jgi:hypothetical protein
MFPKMVYLKQNSEPLSKMSSNSSEVRPCFSPFPRVRAPTKFPSPPHNRQPTEACACLNFKPKITFIVVTKDHKVVFFPKSGDGDEKGNCHAGTVIDTDVVDPVESDYYLYGHAGLLGTSKPAHYTVLVDENDFTCVVSYFLI